MLPVNGYESGSLSVVAGHLYGLEGKICPPAPQEDSAVIAAFVDTLKPQAQVADEPLTFSRFKSLNIDPWVIDDEKGLIRGFAGKLLVEVQANPEMEATHLRSLGQLNFLLWHDFQATEELLQQENPQSALNTAFMAALKEAKTAFDKRITEVKKYGIVKETNDLIRNLMPMALAKLLIDKGGRFNVAIIDDVKSVFFSKVENASETAMAQVLAKLAASKECRDLLDSVTAPSKNLYSWDAIVEMMGVENVTYQVAPVEVEVEESEGASEQPASEVSEASAVDEDNQVEENEEEEVVAPRFEIRIKDADARTCALAAYLADAGAASFSQAL
ncbi:MAG: hypothetical protein LLF94_02195, partial [Chlamydiales bacterium]|nr:hypothetical protein [Chlamydiales bacterium]